MKTFLDYIFSRSIRRCWVQIPIYWEHTDGWVPFIHSPFIRPTTSEESTINLRITMIPTVLINVLNEFSFVGAPLWRVSDGKNLIQVELTFHKTQPTTRYVKKRAERRRQPAPSTGEWPRQPKAARRPPDHRSMIVHRPTPCVEEIPTTTITDSTSTLQYPPSHTTANRWQPS